MPVQVPRQHDLPGVKPRAGLARRRPHYPPERGASDRIQDKMVLPSPRVGTAQGPGARPGVLTAQYMSGIAI
jgi:hypothetical protein